MKRHNFTTGDIVFLAVFGFIVSFILFTTGYKLLANSPLMTLSEGVMITEPKKLSYKGLIWKTWDGWIPVGISQDGNLEKWEFTVYKGDRNVVDCIQNSVGKVKLYYKDYILTPYKMGYSHQVYKCERMKED